MRIQEELVLSKFTAGNEEGSRNFEKLKLLYDGSLPIIEVEGMFKTYINRFGGKKSLSLGIGAMGSSLDFVGLERRLCELAGEWLSSKPESFKLRE